MTHFTEWSGYDQSPKDESDEESEAAEARTRRRWLRKRLPKRTKQTIGAATATPNAPRLENLTPKQIVAELDKYIIGQLDAKRAVAVALRNRYRRQLLPNSCAARCIPRTSS